MPAEGGGVVVGAATVAEAAAVAGERPRVSREPFDDRKIGAVASGRWRGALA